MTLLEAVVAAALLAACIGAALPWLAPAAPPPRDHHEVLLELERLADEIASRSDQGASGPSEAGPQLADGSLETPTGRRVEVRRLELPDLPPPGASPEDEPSMHGWLVLESGGCVVLRAAPPPKQAGGEPEDVP